MQEHTKKEAEKLFALFTNDLESLYAKYEQLNINLEKAILRNKEEEKKRKVETDQLNQRIRDNIDKYNDLIHKQDEKNNKLQHQINDYNKKLQQLDSDIKAGEVAKESIEDLQKKNDIQLEANRKTEEKYKNKLSHLEDDQKSIDSIKSGLNQKEREVEKTKKFLEDKEYKLAQKEKELIDRKEELDLKEKRLFIERQNAK